MIEENKEGYKTLLLGKAEMEHWEITIESDRDAKLYEMLIGEPIKQKKQKKKMPMESLVFIVFGKPAVESLITEGFKSYKQFTKK